MQLWSPFICVWPAVKLMKTTSPTTFPKRIESSKLNRGWGSVGPVPLFIQGGYLSIDIPDSQQCAHVSVVIVLMWAWLLDKVKGNGCLQSLCFFILPNSVSLLTHLHSVSLAGYPFALVYRWFLFYQSATVLHLFHTLSGLALAIFNFGEILRCFRSSACECQSWMCFARSASTMSIKYQ